MTKPKSPKNSPFDLKFKDPARDIKPDPEQAKMKEELDKALKQSFPASDPPSVSQPTTNGPAERAKRR
jgi:hypothetical protein